MTEQHGLFDESERQVFDADNFWIGLDIEKLPRSSMAAQELGIRFFFTNEECVHGHLAPKYTKGGRCVVCAKHAAARQAGRTYGASYGAARANITRAIASIDAKRTYEPAFPCKNGHKLRFVSSNNCVECSQEAVERRKDKAKDERLIRLYGIDTEVRERMERDQDHKCAICSDYFEDSRKLHIDHCHSSGKVRGLLCSQCNQAIGLMKDDRNILLSAIAYLDLHSITKEK